MPARSTSNIGSNQVRFYLNFARLSGHMMVANVSPSTFMYEELHAKIFTGGEKV